MTQSAHVPDHPHHHDLDAHRRDTLDRGRVLRAAGAGHAQPHRHGDVRGLRRHRLARRLPGAQAEPDFLFRRLPRPGRRQVPRLRIAARARAPAACRRVRGAHHHRPGDRDLRPARVDGADRRLPQRGSAHVGQVEDHGADGRHSVPALRRARRQHRHGCLGHLADLAGRGAHRVVHGLLPAEGFAGDPRTRQALTGPALPHVNGGLR